MGLVIHGVGNNKTSCEYGRYQITLSLNDGKNINLSGICLDKIISTFPTYPLREVEKDIRQNYNLAGGSP